MQALWSSTTLEYGGRLRKYPTLTTPPKRSTFNLGPFLVPEVFCFRQNPYRIRLGGEVCKAFQGDCCQFDSGPPLFRKHLRNVVLLIFFLSCIFSYAMRASVFLVKPHFQLHGISNNPTQLGIKWGCFIISNCAQVHQNNGGTLNYRY